MDNVNQLTRFIIFLVQYPLWWRTRKEAPNTEIRQKINKEIGILKFRSKMVKKCQVERSISRFKKKFLPYDLNQSPVVTIRNIDKLQFVLIISDADLSN